MLDLSTHPDFAGLKHPTLPHVYTWMGLIFMILQTSDTGWTITDVSRPGEMTVRDGFFTITGSETEIPDKILDYINLRVNYLHEIRGAQERFQAAVDKLTQ